MQIAQTRLKECCYSITFKRSWRRKKIWEPYHLTRSTCQMLIGALKLFLHLILFIWSLIPNMSLHSAKEEEEAKDIFHLPRNFYLWINQWNNPSLTNILLKKKRKLLNLKSKAECFWVVQNFKDKRQISQRLRFQISSKKKHSLTGWTQLIKKKRNLLKVKRLGH